VNKKYNKNILYLCLFESFLSMTFQRGIFILFLISLGLTNSKIGLLQSALFFTIFLSEIPTGIVGDKLGRKKTLIMGIILNIASLVIIISYNSFIMIFISFILEGIAMAFFSGTGSALFYDSLKLMGKEEKYLKYSGNMGTLTNIIMGLSIAIGPFLKDISWQFVYKSNLVAVLCSGVFLLFVYDNKEDYAGKSDSEDVPFFKEITNFFKENRKFKLELFIIGTSIIEATSAYYYILCQSLFGSQDISIKKIGIIYGVLQIMSGLMYKLAISINSKYTISKISIYSIMVSIIGFSIIIFDNSLLTLVTLLIITAISDILYISKDNYIQKSISSNIRGSLLSIVSFITSVIIGMVYLIFGKLGDVFTPNLTMVFLVVPNILALVILNRYFKFKNTSKNIYLKNLTLMEKND